jgi:hypothetical protein
MEKCYRKDKLHTQLIDPMGLMQNGASLWNWAIAEFLFDESGIDRYQSNTWRNFNQLKNKIMKRYR